MKISPLFPVLIILSGCTTGHINYIDEHGVTRQACEIEYRGAPSVDKHAVNYMLYHCAQKAQAKGFEVLNEEILALSPTIEPHPEGKAWTFEEATRVYQAGKLTDKEYGYLIAYIDLHTSPPK